MKRLIKSFAVDVIKNRADINLYEAKIYSRMKYGDPIATKRIAVQMISLFFKQPEIIRHIRDEETIFISSSAFGSVPTASYAITREVTKLLITGGVKVERIKLIRNGDFGTNHYGTLSAKERGEKMASRKIALSEEDKEKIKDGFVLIIDDIYITGSHERKVNEILENTKAKDWAFVYFKKMEKDFALKSPETEEFLNRAEVKNVFDLLPFFRIYEGQDLKLRMNSRALKFILSTKPEGKFDVDYETKVDQLKMFFGKLQNEILAKLYRAAMSSDGYKTDEKFAVGLALLRKEILQRNALSRFFKRIRSAIETTMQNQDTAYARQVIRKD